jgi:hypothetical protein
MPDGEKTSTGDDDDGWSVTSTDGGSTKDEPPPEEPFVERGTYTVTAVAAVSVAIYIVLAGMRRSAT